MNKLDLRQVGSIMGLPLYVDLASVPDIEIGSGALKMTERDKKHVLIQIMLSKAFGMRKKR